MTKLGIIGAGHIGFNVAKAALAAGYTVVLSNSRGPETLADVIAELGDGASAATSSEAARAGDLVLVAIPLKDIGDIPAEPLTGKIVMDANNYYPERDGHIAALDSHESTTSELLQALLPESHVVKAFNNISAKDIPADATPPGTPGRRALPIAGDDIAAKQSVIKFLDRVGYNVVDMGRLADSWLSERDTLVYGRRTTEVELATMLATTERVQQS